MKGKINEETEKPVFQNVHMDNIRRDIWEP
jgi:hypothetical protein